MVFPLRHSSKLFLDEARLYWCASHGPLIRSLAPVLGIMRSVQVHHFTTPLAELLRAQRGVMEEPYIGHAEVWFDRLARPRERPVPGSPRVGALVLEDEAKFIDFSRSTLFIAKERIVIGN
ncbi:MAG: EthD domain-containing protein [Dehalococcoidia bacterium]|nr:EthD domain-containing protein [Dehalococcoidia bacterium]